MSLVISPGSHLSSGSDFSIAAVVSRQKSSRDAVVEWQNGSQRVSLSILAIQLL